MRLSRRPLQGLVFGVGVGVGVGVFALSPSGLSAPLANRPRLPSPAVCDAVVPKPQQAPLAYKLSSAGKVEVTDEVFERVDQKLFSEAKFRKFVKDHALHDTLNGPGRVEQYDMYINKQKEELLAVIKLGKSLNGYPGVVHGGILGLLLDNSFGILFLNLDKPLSVTANLDINYRAPTYASTLVVLHARIDRVEGRKMYMTARIEDAKTRKVLVESSTLFIAMRKPWWDPLGLLPRLQALLQG